VTSPAAPSALAGIPLFKGLAREELRRLSTLLHPRNFPAGVDIIIEDQPGSVVYVIVEGSVKIHLDLPSGGSALLAVLGPGEVVGEMSVVDSLGRSASVATLEEATLLWMDRDTFWECLRTIPGMTYNLVGLLSRRVRLSNLHIESMAAFDVGGRVAGHLVGLATEYGRSTRRGVVIPFPLTQSDLAALVGASRVRVNQVLMGFRRRGLLTIGDDRRITVRDLARLAKRRR
jgi:CRP/FNR family cyclic AMP-dependent transcriptional regulator